MASLAWTLKAWMALSLPIAPRWRAKHEAERDRWLHMEFRTFRNAVIDVPAQIVRTGRRLIFRLLASTRVDRRSPGCGPGGARLAHRRGLDAGGRDGSC